MPHIDAHVPGNEALTTAHAEMSKFPLCHSRVRYTAFLPNLKMAAAVCPEEHFKRTKVAF